MFANIDDEVIAECKAVVAKYGAACEGTADFCTDDQSVSLHTCFGPPQAGKTLNEDAVLGIQCNDTAPIRWACALADGVGSSMLSEVGSRVATWVAIASLLECSHRTAPREQANTAFAQTLAAIGTLGEKLKNDVSELKYKPPYLPAPAYHYVVDQQMCFQTTLCLVWSDGSSIFVASVGDSGALQATSKHRCQTLFFPEVSDPQVNAICPTLHQIQLDHWQKLRAKQSTLAVFTDGVAKSLVEKHGTQFAKSFDVEDFCSGKQAVDLLADMTATTSEDEADNLSLLVVSSL